MIDTIRSRWLRFRQGDVWPVMPLLFVQFCTGAWILTQMSFFPIYLEEELLYAPMAIATVIAIGQAAGLVAALLGGGLTDAWGSKRVLVLAKNRHGPVGRADLLWNGHTFSVADGPREIAL